MTVIVETPAAAPDGALRRFRRNPLGVAAAVVLVLVLFAAVTARLLAPVDPNFADVSALLQGPSTDHLLGTDRAGRDVLSRLLIGTQVTIAASLLALLIAAAIGVPAGLLAGYYAGPVETAGSWISNILMSLPAVLVLLAVRAVAGPSVWTSMAVFGVLVSPSFYRLVRSSVSVVRHEPYVEAAKVSGLRDVRIMARHVLRVVRAPIIVQAGLVAGIAIGAQSGLEFLGIGDRAVPTWGSQINDAFAAIYIAPQLILAPALAIGITCISLGVFANAVRDALEDRVTATPPTTAKAPKVRQQASSSPKNSSLLAIRDLQVGYRKPDGSDLKVVHEVNLKVERGEVVGLVGASGSGKSQTAFAALGLLPAGGHVLGGSLTVAGQDVTTLSLREMAKLRGTTIAYIPQEPMTNLDPVHTVGDHLVEGIRAKLPLSKQQARERSLELLASVGIRDPRRTFDAYPHEISGGMAQRVLIAGAVSCDPELLIADEPTTALDVTVQAEVLELIRKLQAERGMGVLMVTHNFGVVADLCDRVVVMHAGRTVETGKTQDVFDHPQHPHTRDLLAAVLDTVEPRPDLKGA